MTHALQKDESLLIYIRNYQGPKEIHIERRKGQMR